MEFSSLAGKLTLGEFFIINFPKSKFEQFSPYSRISVAKLHRLSYI
jgi:hypothetical protein